MAHFSVPNGVTKNRPVLLLRVMPIGFRDLSIHPIPEWKCALTTT